MRLRLAAVLLAVGCSPPGSRDDAGQGDSGSVDAGTTDAGPSDGGIADAGADDAGASDAGASDAGASDAGVTDAGPEALCASVTFAACVADAGSNALVRVLGTVVTPQTVICDGEVLLSRATGQIACVGSSCAATPGAASAQVICAEGVIFPGLIDAHSHTEYSPMPVFQHLRHYDNRNTWRSIEPLFAEFRIAHRPFGSTNRPNQVLANRYAEARHLLSGVTASSGTAGTLLTDSNITGWSRNLDSTTSRASELDAGLFVDPDLDAVLVDSAGAVNFTATATHQNQLTARQQSNPLYRAYLAQLGQGLDVAARLEVAEVFKYPSALRMTAVGCIACSTPQLANLRAVGAGLVWFPQGDLDLYGAIAPVTAARALGVPIALATQWPVSGSRSLLGELQCAEKLNRGWLDRAFSDADLVEMVTSGAARALRLDDRLGRLAPGLEADLLVVRGDRTRPFRALLEATPAAIRLVTVKGAAAYGDPDAVAGLIAAGSTCVDVPASAGVGSATGVCGAPRKLCSGAGTDLLGVVSQIDQALLAARAADPACSGVSPTGSYCYAYDRNPLFDCAPPTLARCAPGHEAIPRRAAGGGVIPAVLGAPSAGIDDDGDSVPNATDNCPRVFNPPFDDTGTQEDVDLDGLGDACDLSPCTSDGGVDRCPIVLDAGS